MRAKPLAGEVGLARGEPAPEGGDERGECAGGVGVAFEAEADDEPAEGVGVDRDDPGWEVGVPVAAGRLEAEDEVVGCGHRLADGHSGAGHGNIDERAFGDRAAAGEEAAGEVGGHARSTPAGGDAVEGLHTLSFGRDCAGVQAGGVS